MHFGLKQCQGGRAGDNACVGLSASLLSLGLELGRLKTGTPPRLLSRTIDFSKTQIQQGDDPIPYFSYRKRGQFHVEQSRTFQSESRRRAFQFLDNRTLVDSIGMQIPCFITRTTNKTATIVLNNLDKSPLYSGVIDGVGPRYCPSIEDKMVRFRDKDTHQIFLEPEGLVTEEIYVNGLSTSLPLEVQVELVRSVVGCESAEIVRPGYAVEYDFVFPHQLAPSLETKVCRNLFLAGQINGTSGYEEAAAQGLISGVNAARRVRGLEPIVLRRSEAYIGVLIDDLVTKGTAEPYRMFTSRAENRLSLRHDNADLRLSTLGHEIGLLPHEQYKVFSFKRDAIVKEIARLNSIMRCSDTLAQLLRRPEMNYRSLPGRDDSLSDEVIRQVEVAIKYEGYIKREELEAERFRNLEDNHIPLGFDYERVPSLRVEARQKLNKFRPTTLGEAARISGVSPADISSLLIWMKRSSNDRVEQLAISNSHKDAHPLANCVERDG
jgi:tRNA uridine 5-carboxymethylaminomethyl modification enzyme